MTSANSGRRRSRVPQLHHRGDVDGQELGDVRRGEGAGHHGGRGRLPDPLDRDPQLPGGRVVRRRRRAGSGRVLGGMLCSGGILDVRPADHAVRPGGGDGGQVDARGPSPACAPAGWPAARAAAARPPAAAVSLGRVADAAQARPTVAAGSQPRRLGAHPRRGRRALLAPAETYPTRVAIRPSDVTSPIFAPAPCSARVVTAVPAAPSESHRPARRQLTGARARCPR